MLAGAADETIVRLAWWTGAVSLLMTVLMLAGILVARFLFLARERREKRFQDRWRPLFIRAMAEAPKEAPFLSARDRLMFLKLFNHFQSLVKGEERGRINLIAKLALARPYALSLLESGPMRRRILAAYSLGYMRLKDAINPLEKALDSENTVLSLAAAFALVRIDPDRGVRGVLARVTNRRDWPASAVDRLLHEAGKEAVSPVLREMTLGADEESAPLLIRLLPAADDATAEACESRWVEMGKKDETLSAVLQVVKNPRHLPWVRGMLNHRAWFVRVRAIGALGRIGGGEDKPVLVKMLSDREWWVRYRAAKALAGFPSVTVGELRRMAAGHSDPYAREMLERVAAEAGLGARK